MGNCEVVRRASISSNIETTGPGGGGPMLLRVCHSASLLHVVERWKGPGHAPEWTGWRKEAAGGQLHQWQKKGGAGQLGCRYHPESASLGEKQRQREQV